MEFESFQSDAPLNDLDRAIVALRRSRAALPDLCRCLCEGEVWLPMHFHPELEDEEIELKEGMPFPFARLQTAHGTVVPVYSSEARLEEGLKAGNVPPRTFLGAAMPARQALELLGAMNLPATLNLSCATTGEVTLPAELLRDLANGTALKPLGLGSGHAENLRLAILNPADYPTNLVQAMFELLRKHAHFKAAWIFTRREPERPASAPIPYYVMVLMNPRDDVLFHDLNLVAQSAGRPHPVQLSLADENDPDYLAGVFQRARPFYVAADYHPPGTGDPMAS